MRTFYSVALMFAGFAVFAVWLVPVSMSFAFGPGLIPLSLAALPYYAFGLGLPVIAGVLLYYSKKLWS